MDRTDIVPLPVQAEPANLMTQARANCAERLRAKGHDAEAEAFARGDRDEAWAMKHELARLRAERGQA